MSILFWRHPNERDLALFAGGELGPLARWRIEGHLEDCSPCRQAVSEFFELRSQLMDLGDLPHLDWNAFGDRIRREIERSRSEPRPAPVWRPAWAAAGAFALLLLAGVYVARHELGPAGPVLGVSARGVELRVGSEPSLTLVQAPGLVEAGGASARSFDQETGAITVTHVYAQ
jgi:anti-sigma factor RsiW